MAQVDRAAIAAGISGARLMENAGAGVVRAITGRLSPGRVLLLCGPGNNGGDGYVIARRLAAAGWPVRVAALGDPARLKGDAALAAARWNGPIGRLTEPAAGSFDILVDALFGAGLDRPLDPALGARLHELAAGRPQVVAVDVPSGVDGTTGTVSPDTLPADLTVTFGGPKRGHFLFPGAGVCGQLITADIGLNPRHEKVKNVRVRVAVADEIAAKMPPRPADGHKGTFGRVLIAA
ncbi:MAG: NAD(P)H-hydrate epimerase, partial [Anaerolineales bacterium]|nr:NAD(P)H-hydrate epimerase [Anaerolineales bacterium]